MNQKNKKKIYQYWKYLLAALMQSLIHGLNHCETVLDSLLKDQVSRPLIYEFY